MSIHRHQAFVAFRLNGARPESGLADGINSIAHGRWVIW